jgi:iron complex outermembrane receptor protein
MTYELGGRSEWQTLTPEDRSAVFYVPLSGSASAQWDITEQHQLSVVFTHSQRAPQIQELFTDGFHDATHSYELGNAHLSKELSNNIDLSYRFKADWMTADLTVFHNAVSAYIYQQRDALLFNAATEQFVSTCPPNTDCFPLLTTQQAAASFQGFEAQAVLPLLENNSGVLDLTLFSDVTRGTFDQGGNVPRMPPLRYGMQLTYDQDKWSTNLRLTRGEAQTYAGEHDTNTAAYVLLNLGAQYRLGSYHDADVLLFANAKNLLDENIRNSTSYLRNFAPEPGRGAELGIRVSY